MGLFPNKEGILNETAQQAAERLAARVLPLRSGPKRAEPQGRRPFFVSGMGAGEFALSESDDVISLGVVSGISVHHVGWRQTPVFVSGELTSVTRAEQEVRRLALARLEAEAAHLEAHGVVGVSLRQRHVGKDGHEVSAVGTAIRLTQGEPPVRPFLCTLSGADFWTLRRGGYRPCGAALGVCVSHYVESYPSRDLRVARMKRHLGLWVRSGMEFSECNEAARQTRETALSRLSQSVSEGLAEGVIGLKLEQSVESLPIEDSYSRRRLILRSVAMGTAVVAHRDRWPLIDYAVPLSG